MLIEHVILRSILFKINSKKKMPKKIMRQPVSELKSRTIIILILKAIFTSKFSVSA